MNMLWTVWLPWSAYKRIEHCMTYLQTVLYMVISMFTLNNPNNCIYTCVPKKSDAKIQITTTTAYLIRIKYPLSGFIIFPT